MISSIGRGGIIVRLCVAIPCFFGKTDIIDALETVHRIGYDAVEIYGWKGLDRLAVRDACRDMGIELMSMCTTEFRMTDPAYRSAWLDGLEESCIAANAIGASRLITQVGNDTGAPREEQRASITEALLAARPTLDKYGVTIMMEPLNTYVDHPGYYLWSSAEAFGIVRDVAHDRVKIVYDIYHQQVMEGNIIPSVINNLDCIEHLHAAGHPGRHELQTGENNYNFIFDAIDAAGYTGACGLEYNPLLPAAESLAKALSLYGRH